MCCTHIALIVYHLQNIIRTIELCNPSVADPEGVAPYFQYHERNTTRLGFYMLLNVPFQALDFDIFLDEDVPGPPVKHKRG